MSYFVYRALTPDEPRIRLIHLQPKSAPNNSSTVRPSSADTSEPEAIVRCTISHVSLGQPPPYVALSYTWGDTAQKGRIIVNGDTFHATKSLEVALTHLTPQDAPLTLWIDALCIDQDDEVEKTEQVRQMAQIYSRATSVITWLGPAADNSDAAMRWIQRNGSLAHSFGIGSKPEWELRPLLQMLEADPSKLPHRGLEQFLRDISTELSSGTSAIDNVVTALSKFAARAYWGRVWIVQEMVHGKTVQFVCGSMVVSEAPLRYSLKLLRNFGRYQLVKSASHIKSAGSVFIPLKSPIPVNVFKLRRDVGPFPLIYLIRALRHFKATDPRDKIFALLSFARDAAVLGIYPDYKKSFKEVYLDVTMALVSNGFFDIFSLCDVNRNIPGLPSWVPDFANTTRRASFQQRALARNVAPLTAALQPRFSAFGAVHNTGVSYELSETSPPSLLLHGKFVGKVERVGTLWEPNAFQRWLQELIELASGSSADEPDRLRAALRAAVADQEIRQSNEKPRMSESQLEKAYISFRNLDLSVADNQTFVALGLGDYIYQLQEVARGRRSYRTSEGHFGIGPGEMTPGDLLYILVGADVPYILRTNTDGRLRLVGEAYAYGIMDGEAFQDDQSVDVVAMC